MTTKTVVIPNHNFNKVIKFDETKTFALIEFDYTEKNNYDEISPIVKQLFEHFNNNQKYQYDIVGYKDNAVHPIYIVLETNPETILGMIEYIKENKFDNNAKIEIEMVSNKYCYHYNNDKWDVINTNLFNSYNHYNIIPYLTTWINYHNEIAANTGYSLSIIMAMIKSFDFISMQQKTINEDGVNLIGDNVLIIPAINIKNGNTCHIFVVKSNGTVNNSEYVNELLVKVKNDYFTFIDGLTTLEKINSTAIHEYEHYDGNENALYSIVPVFNHKYKDSNLKQYTPYYSLTMKEKNFCYDDLENEEIIKNVSQIGVYKFDVLTFSNKLLTTIIDEKIEEYISQLPFSKNMVIIGDLKYNGTNDSISKTISYTNGFVSKKVEFEFTKL